MRVQVPLFALMCVALTCAPAAAQEAEALRKEIEQLQKQLQSLSERPFAADWDGHVVWAPDRAGLRFEAVPDAAPPAT